MTDWLQVQRDGLKDALRHIRGRDTLVVAQPFFRIGESLPNLEVHWANDLHFKNYPDFKADIYFNQGYSPDQNRLRYVRSTGRAAVHATWFWDNHHLLVDTMHSAILSDVYFEAHGYCSAYIKNGFSLDGGFVPLCPIFWQMDEVESAAAAALLRPRSELLYGGYNSYAEFPTRDVLIEQIKAHIADSNIFLTRHGTPPDQHPFFGMTPVDRMLEWMHYKVSLCVSFGNNTAIRIFDMLLGGGIPLILGRPADLDRIISRELQDSLPVIVIDDQSPEAVDAAFRLCLARFDEGGDEGVMRRHDYIKSNHMPKHRLEAMVNRIRELAEHVDDVDDILGLPV